MIMKIIYDEMEKEVTNFYEDVAKMLIHSKPGTDVTVKYEDCIVVYAIRERSGTLFITELENNLPDELLPQDIKPVFLTCVNPEKNSYKFYKLEKFGTKVRASYGRMGVQKGELFGERSFDYPLSMFYVKLYEKLSKGYINRTELYLTGNKVEKKAKTANNTANNRSNISMELFAKLAAYAKKAVSKAEVKVPITPEIIEASRQLIYSMMRSATVKEFNENLLELVSILQRPVRTGDGMGVKELMASSESDFKRIIQRETDLLQAMEGSEGIVPSDMHQDFSDFGIEIYEANEKQKNQVMSCLSDQLKGKVHKIYRAIPSKQQKIFNDYLKDNHITSVKQLWHGSRNQNWMSIIRNSLSLNPDAIITGKMFGNGIYFAPSSKKSWNYTSYSGAMYTKGKENTAYMGLYAVAYGKPYDVHEWKAGTDYLRETNQAGCNCLHAHAGKSLVNDEIVFYKESAMVLNYIVEFKDGGQ